MASESDADSSGSGATADVTAELSEQAVRLLLGQLMPATVTLDAQGAEAGQRWMRIEPPHHVDFVPAVGLRVRTTATLQWTAVGLAVPATLNEVTLLVRPVVTSGERGPKLVFRPEIEQADVKFLPAFVDEAIAARINSALAAQGDLVAWHFGETLAQRVAMPHNLTPVDAFHLAAGNLDVTVHEQGIVLKLRLEARFSRLRGQPPP